VAGAVGGGSAADGLDLTALAACLERNGVPVTGPLTARLISGGRSNLTYIVTGGASEWVVRRPPLGQIFPGAHDVAREHRVMRALAGSPVPVPRMIALCDDDSVLGVPFYVMERVPGTVLRTREQVAAIDAGQRALLGEQLVDTLAMLHEVDYHAVGLGDLGRPAGYLERQVARWTRQYQAIKVRDLRYLDEVATVLRATLPQSGLASIVHGDYRLDNVLVEAADPARIAAVLDWEMTTIGDPLADLATLVMFWDEPGRPYNPISAGLTALAGFPSARAVIERYVSRRGLTIDDVDWYLAFAEFKLAVILEQIHARHVAGQTVGEGFGDIGDMVLFLLESAHEKTSRLPGAPAVS